MSVEASKWAWGVHGLSAGEKLVLLCLADHADEFGQNCFPSQKRIADKTCLVRETVSRAISRLRDKGIIKTEPLYPAHTDTSPLLYTLSLEHVTICRGGVTEDHRGSDVGSQGGVTEDHTDPSVGSVSDPSLSGSDPETGNPEPRPPEPKPPLSAQTNGGSTTTQPKRRSKSRTKKKSGGWVCRDCQHGEIRWVGRCPRCGTYESMERVEHEPKLSWQARTRQPVGPPPKQGLSPPPKPETPMEKRLVTEYPGVERQRFAVKIAREQGLTDQDIEALLRWAKVKSGSKQWRDGFQPALHNVILERMWETGDGKDQGGEPPWKREQRNYFPG